MRRCLQYKRLRLKCEDAYSATDAAVWAKRPFLRIREILSHDYEVWQAVAWSTMCEWGHLPDVEKSMRETASTALTFAKAVQPESIM